MKKIAVALTICVLVHSFANNLDLCGPVTSRPCPGSPPFSPPPPFIPPPIVPTPGNEMKQTVKFRSFTGRLCRVVAEFLMDLIGNSLSHSLRS